MRVRARASHTASTFFLPLSCGVGLEDADTSCHTRKCCCLPWECLFDLTEVHCPRDVCVDGTVCCRHTGCRKQHFAAPTACQGLSLVGSKANYYHCFLILGEHLISYRRYFTAYDFCFCFCQSYKLVCLFVCLKFMIAAEVKGACKQNRKRCEQNSVFIVNFWERN